jgi:hypothetical protein
MISLKVQKCLNSLKVHGGSEVIKVNRRPAGVSDWKVFLLFLFLACTCSFVLLLRVFASSESSPPPVPLTLGVDFAARLLVHISKVMGSGDVSTDVGVTCNSLYIGKSA